MLKPGLYFGFSLTLPCAFLALLLLLVLVQGACSESVVPGLLLCCAVSPGSTAPSRQPSDLLRVHGTCWAQEAGLHEAGSGHSLMRDVAVSPGAHWGLAMGVSAWRSPVLPGLGVQGSVRGGSGCLERKMGLTAGV